MAFSQDFDVKDRVKQATDVVDLVGSSITLRRQGSSYKGLCPFHEDKRPSFDVNPARQSWACWVCDLRGDVFDFIMRIEGVDFREALKILAERAGIELTASHARIEKGSANDKTTLFKAMQWAEQEYHQCLLRSDAAIPIREYLLERGITQDSIETFRIGFAPLSWSWLVDRARNSPFTPEVLEACGLVSANQRGGWYERFRGRVLFPIRDTMDRAIAFGGRVVPSLYGDNEEVPPAKYVNSPETRLFSKSKNLYALNLCRPFLQKSDQPRLTIVEGYTDVIAAWQAGLRNVVAALGTAVNEQHIQLIKRFADGITLVLDGDEAGQKRTNEILDLFVANDIDLRILTLPEGLDPFDFLSQNGGQPFQEMVDAAPDAIAHKIISETRGVDVVNDTHRSQQALNNILKTLARLPKYQDSAEKDMRLDQIVMRLGRQFQLAPEQVKRRLSELQAGLKSNISVTSSQARKSIQASGFDRTESELVQLLIQSPGLLDTAIEKIVPDEFQPGPLQELYRIMETFFHEGKDVGYEQLMLELETNELKSLVIWLYEEAIAKRESANQLKSDINQDLESQLASIIDAYEKKRSHVGWNATISQLHGGQLDADQEALALQALFEHHRQLQQSQKKP